MVDVGANGVGGTGRARADRRDVGLVGLGREGEVAAWH